MTRDEYIKSEQEWLYKNLNRYSEAQENMSNPKYVKGLLRGIEDKLTPALSYNPADHPPHMAVFILGALQARVEKLLTDLDFIDDYETRREDLAVTIANAESQDDGSHLGPPDDLG